MTVNNQSSHAILFVDDEEKARKMFTRLVSSQFTVLTAADVKEAKELLEKKHEEIGVLITDQRMPGELGVDLLRHVRKEYPKLIRMLTTAYTDLDDAIEAVNTGEIFRYINKPWNADELLIDLQLAMNFFDLEQDRQQLIQEKMSLSHRQSKLEMIKSLMTMSSAQSHYNRPKQAISSFLKQVSEPQAMAEEHFSKAASSYWDNEISKTEKMIQINQSLNTWLEQASGFIQDKENTETVDYQSCFDQLKNGSFPQAAFTAGSDLSQNTLNQQGISSVIDIMLQTLADKNSENGLSVAVDNTEQGIQISATASAANIRLAEQLLTTGDAEGRQKLGQLLASYILIYHLGGEATLSFKGADLAKIEVEIPKEMPTDLTDLQDNIWIEDIFVLYS